jgi:hypothetical protein
MTPSLEHAEIGGVEPRFEKIDGAPGAARIEQGYISPAIFAKKMAERWTAQGNVSSKKLEHLWQTMAATFNAAAENSRDGKWRILEAPTGTGKTQGVCVYAAMLIDRNRPAVQPLGMLIVTRTIVQADEIVDAIRGMMPEADRRRVAAKHSKCRLKTAAMKGADVLVITHEAYTRALEGFSKNGADRWEALSRWQHGPRRLTVIDEALASVIEGNKVVAEDVRQTLGRIDRETREKFPKQVEALQKVLAVLEAQAAWAKLQDAGTEAYSSKIAWRNVDESPTREIVSMGQLRKAMKGIDYDRVVLRKDDASNRKRLANITDETLKGCEAILRSWAYYHRKGRKDTFNSAQLLIPDGLPGPVVLDATARQNFLWRLLENRAETPDIPEGVRRYDNVRLHVARVRGGVGKSAMIEHKKVRIPRLLAHLREHLSPDRKVFICVHMDVEYLAVWDDHPFAEYGVGHWNAIDGKNDWQHCDTAVIFGLPYRDTVWSTNTFFALQGLRDDDWMANPRWRDYADIRSEMERRQLAVSVIQAINRVRCRRVIDAEGNCLPTDVFIVLPADKDGDAVLSYLKDEMPGIRIAPWDFKLDGKKPKVRNGSSHKALVSFMKTRLSGETPMGLIQKELGISADVKKKLQRAIQDRNHPLAKELTAIGVTYQQGRGRGSASYLLKR